MESVAVQETITRLRRWHAALVAGMSPAEGLQLLARQESDPEDAAALAQAAAEAVAGRPGDRFPGPLPLCLQALIRSGAVRGEMRAGGSGLAAAVREAVRLGERLATTDEDGWEATWWEALGAMVDGGVPILTIMEALGSAPFPRELREAAILVREDVRDGRSLAEALRRQPQSFAPAIAEMVAAAEQSGQLAPTCREIALCLPMPIVEQVGVAVAVTPAPEAALLHDLLARAVAEGAKSLHLHPLAPEAPRSLLVRWRTGGRLVAVPPPEGGWAANPKLLVPALKAWAGLDVLSRHGLRTATLHFPRDSEPTHALHVTVYWSQLGETADIRIQPHAGIPLKLDALGMAHEQAEAALRLVRQPCGLLVLAGSPRSGRRTTAYALLSAINSVETSIHTLEPAIEQRLPGIHQTALLTCKASTVSEEGMTYTSGLRQLLLFQDPDVLYLASLSDPEALGACLEAVLSERRVLGGLEARDAADALALIRAAAPAGGLLGATLIGIVAQRSLRLVCPDCARREPFTRAERRALLTSGLPEERLADAVAARAVGCGACRHTGYRGRTAVFEVLVLPDEHLAVRDAPPAEVARHLVGGDIRYQAAAKVAAGLTAIEDAARSAGL
ncbi:MAG: Flp pilus assembly complex ATPase component TadA [Armatimonadetes bacterium]|nr:Flp pilus assembly complex ATPase component TadA [Armatimonadota bacterium]